MTPPNRPKRPSARPAARPSAPPPAATHGKPAQLEARAQVPESTAKARAKSGKKHRPRVAARRASVLPAKAVAAAAPVLEPTKAAIEPPAPSTERRPQARAKTPESKHSGADSQGVSRAHPEEAAASAPPRSPAPVAAEEEDDIWSDVAPIAVEMQAGAESLAGHGVTPSSRPAARLVLGTSASESHQEAALIGSAQSLLSTDYYFRQYGAHGMRSLSAEVDEFGLDPHVEESARPALELLCKRYFRVSVSGGVNLPKEGRALIVANRSGTVPWDGLVLRTALRIERPELPPVRWLSEDSVIHYPFLGTFMNRLGAVRACQENAERLLSQDKLVAVFPEGAHGSSKLFKDRYRLQRFGRGGYVRLALKFGAPIIPTAIIGAEETNPLLARSRLLGKALGADFLPITPTFPWLGPVGLLPAPVKWRIVVGEPIDVTGYGPDAADDALLVHKLNDQIRSILQGLVDKSASSRGSVLFG